MLTIFYNTLLLLISGMFLPLNGIPEKTSTYTVYINFKDCTVRANLLYDSEKVKAKNGHTYYWYINNDIKKTDGSFDGKLLHGEYKSFFLDMNLKEQGLFNYGLKEGIWKSWFSNGKIHEISVYKNGLEHGVHEVYDENGNLSAKKEFKNGVQNGKSIFYKNGKIDTVITFKDGKPKPQRQVKTHQKSKKNEAKDSLKTNKANRKKPQDTVADTPKSSFSIKNIFNKKKKATQKPVAKKEKKILPEKDRADKSSKKKS
jgi:hypothetical protein